MRQVPLLLQSEVITGVSTDPTGEFSDMFGLNPAKIFRNTFGMGRIRKQQPMQLELFLAAPKPKNIGFAGWRYEGWLIDQGPTNRRSSATSVNPEFGGIPHPDLDPIDYPITTGLFNNTGMTLEQLNLNVFTNRFTFNQTAWPFDLVVITFEPPETGAKSQDFDPRPDPVRPATGTIR